MRIYVADLAAYNEGSLVGEWIDLDGVSDADTLQETIQELLAKWSTESGQTREEYAIHDYDGPKGFAGYFADREHPDLKKLVAFTLGYEAHGEAFALFANTETDPDLERFEEAYQGVFSSLADWAQSFHEDTGTELGSLSDYIDWERWARDAELSGDIWSERGDKGVHVFWNR